MHVEVQDNYFMRLREIVSFRFRGSVVMLMVCCCELIEEIFYCFGDELSHKVAMRCGLRSKWFGLMFCFVFIVAGEGVIEYYGGGASSRAVKSNSEGCYLSLLISL